MNSATSQNPTTHLVHVVRDLELASGGPSRSIPQLVLALDRLQHFGGCWQQSVIFLDRGQSNAQFTDHSQALQVLPTQSAGAPLMALSRRLARVHAQRPVSLLHVHGLWNLPAHFTLAWARQAGIPYVVSPRGMLSSWCFNHKRWKKEIGWWLYQRRDLNAAAAIHVTSPDELVDVQRMGLRARIEVVPNGSEQSDLQRVVQHKSIRTALCLTRLHPVKGLDLLIEVWARLKPENWRLIIAGPSESGMREKLASLIEQNQLSHCVELRGQAEDDVKRQLFSQADLFLLPSKSENFGMVIAEALSSGLPVVTTTGTPWSDIVSYECGWYVAPDGQSLTAAIADAVTQSPEKLHSMGSMGRRLVADRFAWPAVAPKMKSFYSSLLMHR